MTSSIYADIGANVRAEREKLGMTQEGLAQRVGFLRTSVTNIEAGRQRVPIHTLIEVAAALGCTVGDLLPPAQWPRMSAAVAAERIAALEAKLQDAKIMLQEIIEEL